jgi:hypothetical protein
MKPEPKKIKLENFILSVDYVDGQSRQIDFRTFFSDSNPQIREIKKSESLFKTAKIEDGAAITWSNGFSLDPDVVYDEGIAIQPVKATGATKRILAALRKVVVG